MSTSVPRSQQEVLSSPQTYTYTYTPEYINERPCFPENSRENRIVNKTDLDLVWDFCSNS